jgi:hypothetical protein
MRPLPGRKRACPMLQRSAARRSGRRAPQAQRVTSGARGKLQAAGGPGAEQRLRLLALRSQALALLRRAARLQARAASRAVLLAAAASAAARRSQLPRSPARTGGKAACVYDAAAALACTLADCVRAMLARRLRARLHIANPVRLRRDAIPAPFYPSNGDLHLPGCPDHRPRGGGQGARKRGAAAAARARAAEGLSASANCFAGRPLTRAAAAADHRLQGGRRGQGRGHQEGGCLLRLPLVREARPYSVA